MTLIVGIRCTDGALVAADSAVTFGPSAQLHTISDKHCKIQIIKNKMIVAGTGQVGMGQRFAWHLEQAWEKGTLKGGDPIVMSRAMCTEAIKDFQSTSAHTGTYGALAGVPSIQESRNL